jgi:hypothetical protein
MLMRPTPGVWTTWIDAADSRGSRARDRETIEIEYPSAARGRRRLVGNELLADDHVRVVRRDGSLLRELVLDVSRDYQPQRDSSVMS